MGEPPLLGWGFRAQVQPRSPTNMRRSCSSYMESAGQRSGETWPERSRVSGADLVRPWLVRLCLVRPGLWATWAWWTWGGGPGVVSWGSGPGVVDLGMISENLVAGAPTRRLLRPGAQTTE